MISFQEVARRKVVQWALAYLAGAWALLQVLDLIAGSFDWPQAVTRVGILVAGFGVLVTLVVSWYHGERGAQRVSSVEILMLGGIFALAGATVMWVTSGRVASRETEFEATATAKASADRTRSVAVLPFVDLSPRKDQEYFSDGITEEIITALARVEGLRVPGRTSSFQFKGKNRDLRQVGRALGVGYILEGSVQRLGDSVRITAQLVDATTGYHRWADRYDRRATDLFAIEDEISRAIAAQLRFELAPGAVLAQSGTADLTAHDLYLQGRYAAGARTAPGLARAVRFLQQAVQHDPNYAPAYVGLADTYLLQLQYDGGARRTLLEKANAAASRAVALDSSSAEVQTTLGKLATDSRRFALAGPFFRRALALDSSYAPAHHWYGVWLGMRGRIADARRELALAYRLDPLSSVIATAHAWTFYLAGDYDGAIQRLKATLQLDPDFAEAHHQLAWCYAMQRRFDLGVRELEAVHGPDLAGEFAWMYARSGDRARALQLVRELMRRRARGDVPALDIALAYDGLGDRAAALHWLEQAWEEGDGMIDDIKVDPRFADLRSEPHFRELTARVLGPGADAGT